MNIKIDTTLERDIDLLILEEFISENIVDVIETAQGCHLITKKFDSETFKEFFEKIFTK